MGPSCRMCSSRTSGLSLLRSRWMKVRVSCTSTDGTSVKRSVSPCQIWSPAERYVELRYSAAVVSAVNRDTDTKMELGSRILTQQTPPSGGLRRAASLGVRTSITFPPSGQTVSRTDRRTEGRVTRGTGGEEERRLERGRTALCRAPAAAAARVRSGGRRDVCTGQVSCTRRTAGGARGAARGRRNALQTQHINLTEDSVRAAASFH